MDAMASKGVQVSGKNHRVGLAFTGSLFGNSAMMKGNGRHKLDIISPFTNGPFDRPQNDAPIDYHRR